MKSRDKKVDSTQLIPKRLMRISKRVMRNRLILPLRLIRMRSRNQPLKPRLLRAVEQRLARKK